MHYCQPVDLEILHSWDTTVKLVKNLISAESHAKFIETHGSSDHYSVGNIGTLSKHQLSTSWNRIASPVVNKTMPWLQDMLDKFSELKPDDGCISVLIGDGGAHVDDPEMKTALNFVFYNTDPDAYTWVGNNKEERYQSIINTAWLLDTQQPHGIINSGERWTLSIHFNTDYNIVKQWFDSNPKLVFGETNK